MDFDIETQTNAVVDTVGGKFMEMAGRIVDESRKRGVEGMDPLCMQNAGVFLIEDDPTIRLTIEDYLVDDGHEVIMVTSSREESLAQIKGGLLGVDVVVLDNDLGGKRCGQELAKQILKKYPDMKIIWNSRDEQGLGLPSSGKSSSTVAKMINAL